MEAEAERRSAARSAFEAFDQLAALASLSTLRLPRSPEERRAGKLQEPLGAARSREHGARSTDQQNEGFSSSLLRLVERSSGPRKLDEEAQYLSSNNLHRGAQAHSLLSLWIS